MKRTLFCLSCCFLVSLLVFGNLAVARESAKAAEPAEKAEKSDDDKTKDDAEPKDDTTAKDDAEAAKPTAAAPAKPAVHTVKPETLKIEVSLDGVIEAKSTEEIALRPDTWSTFSVLKAVEHGTEVRKGELLVAFDPEKIDRAIDDLKRGNKASTLAIKLAERQLAALEKTTPMDLVAAERALKESRDDLDYYFKISRPMSLKMAEFSLKYSKFSLEYAQEELDQLKKMYEADDLTEETEEIILKRAERAVESAKFSLERDLLSHERLLKTSIPRRDTSNKEVVQRNEIAVATSKAALPLALSKARTDLAELKIAQTRAVEKLDQLVADRALMTIKSPSNGVVYYGNAVRGKFSTDVKPGGLELGTAVAANSVIMTIVKPRPVLIRATVPEKELHNVREGIQGKAVPTGYPELKLDAIVQEVGRVPISAGNFDAKITMADADADTLMPGMTVKVELVPYLTEDALTIPPKALGTDPVDEDKHFVQVVGKKDTTEKREVTVGRRTDEQVEILKGLKAGEKVLAEYPKDEK